MEWNCCCTVTSVSLTCWFLHDRTLLLFEHSDVVVMALLSALFITSEGSPSKVGDRSRS